MSQYRYSDGEAALYRLPVTVEATAGGTVNLTVSLAGINDLDLFWSNVQTDGYDIRLVSSDGKTIIAPTAWDIQSFSKSSRTGTIRVQGLAVAAGMDLLWLVWGKPAGDASSAWVGSPTPSSPKTTYIHRADPLKVDPARVFTGA